MFRLLILHIKCCRAYLGRDLFSMPPFCLSVHGSKNKMMNISVLCLAFLSRICVFSVFKTLQNPFSLYTWNPLHVLYFKVLKQMRATAHLKSNPSVLHLRTFITIQFSNLFSSEVGRHLKLLILLWLKLDSSTD